MRLRPWLAVVLLSACADQLTSPRTDVATLSVDGSTLELSVTASTTTLRAGAYDTIGVTLANTGPSPVRLDFPSGCQVLLYIRDSAGHVVLPDGGAWACTAALTHLSLGVGQSVVNHYVWTGSTAVWTDSTGVVVHPLSPGAYRVTASVSADQGAIDTAPLAITLEGT